MSIQENFDPSLTIRTGLITPTDADCEAELKAIVEEQLRKYRTPSGAMEQVLFEISRRPELLVFFVKSNPRMWMAFRGQVWEHLCNSSKRMAGEGEAVDTHARKPHKSSGHKPTIAEVENARKKHAPTPYDDPVYPESIKWAQMSYRDVQLMFNHFRETARMSTYVMAMCNLIMRHAVPANLDTPIRDMIAPKVFQGMLAEAKKSIE